MNICFMMRHIRDMKNSRVHMTDRKGSGDRRRQKMIPRYRIHVAPLKCMFYQESAVYDMNHCAAILCSSDFGQITEHIPFRYYVKLEFQDTCDPRDRNAFSFDQAERITQYISGLPADITDLFIACDAGCSRSPAVAAALLRASGGSDKTIWGNPRYYPNPLVYERVCKALGLFTPKMMISYKVRVNRMAYRKTQRNHD